MVNDYPQVNLFADKPQSNINKCEISKEDIAKAIVLLRRRRLRKLSPLNVDIKVLSMLRSLSFDQV